MSACAVPFIATAFDCSLPGGMKTSLTHCSCLHSSLRPRAALFCSSILSVLCFLQIKQKIGSVVEFGLDKTVA